MRDESIRRTRIWRAACLAMTVAAGFCQPDSRYLLFGYKMTYSLPGNLLVASTLVTDPIFAGGVCLVMHQDENHTIGVMLNRPLRPTPEALAALLGSNPDPHNRLSSQDIATGSDAHETNDEAAEPETSDGPTTPSVDLSKISPCRMVHFGGPLSGPVLAIHQQSQFAEAETGIGIYVAAQKGNLEDLLRHEAAPYRLIVGHLGWKGDQVEQEIEAGAWHVVPATVEAVFSPAADMWPQLIRRATSSSLAKWIGVPDNVRACELN